MSTPRRVAVVEVNHWHSTYDAAYLTVLQNLDLDLELVGVSDSDTAIAEDRARRYETTAFTDYREMVDATKPDFVIALGRHAEMPEIARFLIEADIPFLMEKPMGTSADVVRGLADLTEERGAWVSVPFPNRQSPWAEKAREMIAADEFGPISHIVFRIIRPTMQRYVEWDSPWMLDRSQAGGGALTAVAGIALALPRDPLLATWNTVGDLLHCQGPPHILIEFEAADARTPVDQLQHAGYRCRLLRRRDGHACPGNAAVLIGGGE